MITHASSTAEALMSTGLIVYFTAGQLHAILRTDRCEGCGLFLLAYSRRRLFLYLPRPSTRRNDCLCSKSRVTTRRASSSHFEEFAAFQFPRCLTQPATTLISRSPSVRRRYVRWRRKHESLEHDKASYEENSLAFDQKLAALEDSIR